MKGIKVWTLPIRAGVCGTGPSGERSSASRTTPMSRPLDPGRSVAMSLDAHTYDGRLRPRELGRSGGVVAQLG